MLNLTRNTISKLFILAIAGVLVWAVLSFNWNRAEALTVRETYECVAKICNDLPGAGEACTVIKQPKITKITISDYEGAVTVRFTPTTDRCADGSD